MTIHPLHCEICGRRLPAEADFCPQCGHHTHRAVEKKHQEPATEQFESPVGSRSTWHLMIVRPDGEQLSYPLPQRLTIGRSPDSDLQLQDSQASRTHALIEKGPAGYTLSDQGSSNGTYLNRKRIHMPIKLRVGDTITIGGYRLLVQRGTLNCGNCGRPVRSDDIFCIHCGQPLTGVPVDGSPAPAGDDYYGLPTDPLEEPVRGRNKEAQEEDQRFSENLPPLKGPAKASMTSHPQVSESSPGDAPPSGKLPARPEPERPAPARRAPASSSAAPASSSAAPASSSAAPASSVNRKMDPPAQRNWVQTCAVLAVVGLCLFAAAAASAYWYYVNYFLPTP